MAQGDILYRGASAWLRLAAGTAGQFLKTQGAGANPAWDNVATGGAVVTTGSPANGNLTKFSGTATITNGNLSGDVTTTDTLTTTIANDAVTTAKILNANVTDAKISNRTANSVFGRAANSSGVGADIAAANVGESLQLRGTTVQFSTLGMMVYVVAAADDDTNNDTMKDDDELFFTAVANAVYAFELSIMFNCGASNTPDCKVGINLPSGTISNRNVAYPTTATATTEILQSVGFQQAALGPLGRGVLTTATAANSPFFTHGIIRIGVTGGTVMVQFAQNTTTGGNPLVRKADSYLRYTRIS